MEFTDLEKEFNEKHFGYVGMSFSDENYRYVVYNKYDGKFWCSCTYKVPRVITRTRMSDGKTVKVNMRHAGSDSVIIDENFFKKFKFKPFKEIKVTSLKPKKSHWTKIENLGKKEMEWYPGGFPSHYKVKEVYENFMEGEIDKWGNIINKDKPSKFQKIILKINDKKEILELLAVAKEVFGEYSKSYKGLMDRALKMNASEDELKLVEDFKSSYKREYHFKW